MTVQTNSGNLRSVAEPEPVEQQLFAGAGYANSCKMLQKP
jgi:hypothetical protein